MPSRFATIEDVAENAQVGDIVICMGSGFSSWFISWVSPYKDTSHVMVVVPGPRSGQRCLSDAYEENTGTPCYRNHGPKPIGVQCVGIKERLKNYSSGKLIWRKLNRNYRVSEMGIQCLRAELNSWTEDSVPGYFKRSFCCDFVEVGGRTNDDDDIHPDKTAKGGKRKYYVCTTWAAHALQQLEIVDETLDPGDFNLGDFASTTNPVFGSRATYGPFIHIDTLEKSNLKSI